MKSNRLLFHLVLILCCGCLLFQTWAASPGQPGSSPQAAPGAAPIKPTLKATPVQKPDLIIATAGFNHAPQAGEQLGTDSILNIQVKNQGALQAPQNTVKITCTPLAAKPCPAGLSGSMTCGGLGPNQSTTLSWPNSGGAWTAGVYRLAIEADSGNAVDEISEGNNTKTLNVTIMAHTTSGSPAQGAAGSQYSNAGGSAPPSANPGQAGLGKKKQAAKFQNPQNTQAASGAGSTQNMSLSPLSITSPANGAVFLSVKITTSDGMTRKKRPKM